LDLADAGADFAGFLGVRLPDKLAKKS